MEMTWLHKFFGLFFIPANGWAKSAQQLISTVLPFHPLYFPWILLWILIELWATSRYNWKTQVSKIGKIVYVKSLRISIFSLQPKGHPSGLINWPKSIQNNKNKPWFTPPYGILTLDSFEDWNITFAKVDTIRFKVWNSTTVISLIPPCSKTQ